MIRVAITVEWDAERSYGNRTETKTFVDAFDPERDGPLVAEEIAEDLKRAYHEVRRREQG